MALDPELTRRLAEQGDTPAPLFDLDSKTCAQCGETFHRRKGRPRREFAKQRFCSKSCSWKGIARTGRKPSDACKKGHPWTEETTRWSGHRRNCRICDHAYDQARTSTTRRTTTSPTTRRRRPKPQPAQAPAAPVVERPVWRPAGFTPEPNVLGRRTA